MEWNAASTNERTKEDFDSGRRQHHTLCNIIVNDYRRTVQQQNKHVVKNGHETKAR